VLGYTEPVYGFAAFPLGVFFLLYGVGGVLHRWRQHVWRCFLTFLGVVAVLQDLMFVGPPCFPSTPAYSTGR